MLANELRNARISTHVRVMEKQGQTFALEQQSSDVFQAVAQAARSGFPRALVIAAKSTIDAAIAQGERLSPRTAELLKMLNGTLKGMPLAGH